MSANKVSPKGKTKIFWSKEESEGVAKKAYEFIAKGRQTSWQTAIYKAQYSVVKPNRIRSETALSGSATKNLKELALKLAGADGLLSTHPVTLPTHSSEADSLITTFATQLADRFGKELTEKLSEATAKAIKKVEHEMMTKTKR